MASAAWLAADKTEDFAYVANKVRQPLTTAELQNISRVVIVAPESPLVMALQAAVDGVNQMPAELDYPALVQRGLAFDRAIVISSLERPSEREKRTTVRR